MPPTWLINGTAPAALGLANPRLSYNNLKADTCTLDHPADWDADPLFNYGDLVTITRNGVVVFSGKVRTTPRSGSAQAESLSYTIAGPWDWLERRALLQNTFVVLDPDVSTIPIEVPTGFVVLHQAEGGASVNIATGLATVINAAIAAGVPILLGAITGFDYLTAWDEVADLTYADAITRLLVSAPDAVASWDYTTTTLGVSTPTIHIGRRANLPVKTLAIAPKGTLAGAYGPAGYAEFESIRLTNRPDLLVGGVFLTFRSINTVNGETYLKLTRDIAGDATVTAAVATLAAATAARTSAAAAVSAASSAYLTALNGTDEGAIAAALAALTAARTVYATAQGVEQTAQAALDLLATGENILNRTVQLAGSNYSETVTATDIKTLPLSDALGNGTLDNTGITSGATFDALKKFWLRKHPALAAADVVIQGFAARQRLAAPVADVDANGYSTQVTPALDTSLVRELVLGTITAWMETSGLNRQSQEQTYSVAITYTKKGVTHFGETFIAGVMATNCDSRRYSFQESSDFTEPEPTPIGMAASLYAAMGVLQHEGQFALVQDEATLDLRPGQVLNLTGGRAAWTTMRAVVQQVSATLQDGRTQVTLGWPKQLTPDDLTSIARANRLKQPAYRGLTRDTGKV